MNKKTEASFTLVELLIVIGILAILTAAVIVVLNPADLLQQSRDSKRLQDLSSLESTINLAESIHPDIDLGTASTVYISIPSDQTNCSDLGLPTLPTSYIYACVSEDNLYNTDGTGWIPINFQDTDLAGVITLSSLPTDPTNTTSTGLYYTYIPGGSYELTAILESDKYRTNTTTDGGDSFSVYEKGTNLTLAPYSDSGLVGYWPFEEGTGTTTEDMSGSGNTGTLVNSPVWLSERVMGGGVNINGTGKRITSANPIGGSVATISLWYKRSESDAASGYRTLVAVNTGNTHHLLTQLGDQKLGVFDGSFRSFAYTPPDDGQWHHYCVIYVSATNASLYVDGSYQGQVAIVLDLSTYPIGSFGNWSSGGYWAGPMDDVRIYNRALSVAEIQSIYNATR